MATNPLSFDFAMSPSVHLLVGSFDTLGLSIQSFREPLKQAIQKVMAPSFKKNFDLGGRPPWAELNEDTLAQKTYYASPAEALVRTGLLRKVAQQLNLWTIGQDEAVIQQMPRAEYGAIHQEGSASIPQREWAIVQPEDMDDIEEVFMEWFAVRLAAVGFARGAL